jgi:flagellar motor switch protein FliM
VEPILKKEEIARLLAAIREGRVSLDLDDDTAQIPNLECTPVDLFNLVHPEKDQFRIPNFDIILDMFCRTYSTSLTNNLQRTFSITRTSLESTEFQNYFMDNNNLGAIGIIEISPLKYGALVILDPKLSFSLIEIMLGASIELDPLHLDRNLTTIELTVLRTLFIDACKDLDKAFSQLIETSSSLIKLENNPRLVSIVEPEAEVIVGTFLVKMGDLSGEIHLVFPFATLEPLRDLLKELLNITTVTKSTWSDIIEDEIMDLPTVVTAQSGIINLTVAQILALKKGEVLELGYDPNNPLKVLVEDQVKFNAIPGTHNGRKAISLSALDK